MSASVYGRDVDPLACALVLAELEQPEAEAAAAAAKELTAYLSSNLGHLFDAGDGPWTPLHWFWLRRVHCPQCNARSLVYRDLVLARSQGRVGSVVRDADTHAFCPDCLSVHALRGERKVLECCGRRRPLTKGTFISGKFHCEACSATSSYEAIQPGQAERVLVAVEETHPKLRRRLRTATAADRTRAAVASTVSVESPYERALQVSRRDRRPVSLGFASSRSLFSDRQWQLFTTAFAWVDSEDLPATVQRALRLVLSAILPSNSLLCGYARDYGRLPVASCQYLREG
jgi:putative DNA methylase